MVHFLAKWSHLYNLPTAFLNTTRKPDVTNFIFDTDNPVIMPNKKDKFYIYIL